MVRIIRVGKDMAAQFEYGAANISRFLVEALVSSANSTIKSAKLHAPVYNPLRYPEWSHRPHAHKAGGRLRRSLKVSKPTVYTKRVSIKLYSNAYYASYMEDGFTHRWQHDRVHPGKKFLSGSVNVVFKKNFPKKCDEAFLRAFGGK